MYNLDLFEMLQDIHFILRHRCLIVLQLVFRQLKLVPQELQNIDHMIIRLLPQYKILHQANSREL